MDTYIDILETYFGCEKKIAVAIVPREQPFSEFMGNTVQFGVTWDQWRKHWGDFIAFKLLNVQVNQSYERNMEDKLEVMT